jgi:serine/threonine protein kinase/tetratricopeptide (TPR) repeat protein
MSQNDGIRSAVPGSSRAGADQSGDDSRLARAVQEYRELLRAGQRPDRREFLSRYPEVAGELADCLSGLDFLHGAAQQMSEPIVASPASPGTAVDQPLAGGCLGDFRIVREVGRGGMGVVYEAEQVSLGRRVALKVLPFAATMDPRHLQRFHNEARAAGSLHHTNIVPVYAVGCERGVHYYAMQFIDGRTLADFIAQERGDSAPAVPTTAEAEAAPAATTLAPAAQATSAVPHDAGYFRRVAEWGIQAAEALDHAHQLGIVHRDVKPASLLVDATGRLWVTDFGLAQVQSDPRVTMTGDLVGTLRYMSPEQALAQRVVIDHRTDIYSLGATLYELLALEPAFPGTDRQELLRQIAFEEPRRPRRVNKAIPAELETIVLKAMEKNPPDRYATAQALASDLRHWLEDRPIKARRPSLWQVASKWARRHKPVVWSAAAVLLVTVLAGGGTWLWWAHKRGKAEAVVRTQLGDADGWRQQGRWDEGLNAVRRADAVLASVGADHALRQEVERVRKDLEMARRLEDLHVLAGADPGSYADAFLRYGLDVEHLDAEAAAQAIRSSLIGPQLAEGLDYWASNCRTQAPERCQRLLAVARIVDPDPLRNMLRGALEKGDAGALHEIVRSASQDERPPATALLLLKYCVEVGASEPAVRCLYKVQQRNPANFRVNMALGYGCFDLAPRQLTEALCYFRAAVALRPDSSTAHELLAIVLDSMGRYDENIAELREAVRLDRSNLVALGNLGCGLARRGRPGEAEEGVAMCREVVLRTSHGAAHFCLAQALYFAGRLDEAVNEYRIAQRGEEQLPPHPHRKGVHLPLGRALAAKGLWDEALVEYREAVRIDKDDPDAQLFLGMALSHMGRVNEAVATLRRAIQLDPQSFEDPRSYHRYNAACAAAQAGCGQGKDTDGLDEKKRASLRQQALDWLRTDLTAWNALLETDSDSSRPAVMESMRHWLADADFNGVRGDDALNKLPDAERQPWRRLWADVADLLARAQDKAAPEKKPGAK